MKSLIACAGLRDPIWTNTLDRRSYEDQEVRQRALDAILHLSAMTDGEIKDFISKATQQNPNLIYMLGPVASALTRLKERGQAPEKLYLLYTETDDMNKRIEACISFLPGRFCDLVRLPIEKTGFADYDRAFAQVKGALTPVLNAIGNDAAFLIGPATPQLNLAMMLFKLQFMPAAALWHVKNSKDVELINANKPYASMENEMDFVEIRFDGEFLPKVIVGEIDEQIQLLKDENERLRSSIEAAPRGRIRKNAALPKLEEAISKLRATGCEKISQEMIAKEMGVSRGRVSQLLKQNRHLWPRNR
jgi:uncharacterized small protein (DUF1192 family)